MTFVGATGVKTFTDDSPPANALPCTCRVTAVRSIARGNPGQFTVNFGVGGGGWAAGGGLTIASITNQSDGANVKMAAQGVRAERPPASAQTSTARIRGCPGAIRGRFRSVAWR